ncbi:MAG: asparagine synthase (glutamine-hydrolyzing) [Myxococcales bacterium]|nr:asparagine synthase (glutamine-hydrolyzing) [Myxococcales bacterium]
MCGVTGLWARSAMTSEEVRATLEAMTATLAHRGPDDRGAWIEPEGSLGLGHRRLSIIDLSPEGRQPMISARGRYVISYNGEVYNHRDIRRELEAKGAAPRWRGTCDTEVMLAAIEHGGIRWALDRFIGMFAFALWDQAERRLFLVRDRIGVKPLYYAFTSHGLAFGSELKAVIPFPGFDREIDRDSLADYVRISCVPAPRSIYRQARKVRPGTILAFSSPTAAPAEEIYWSAEEVARLSFERPFKGSEREALEELDSLLRDAVKLRMVADVPLGALLSGGVDSSTVVALMQAQSSRPVHSFSIGSQDPMFDESPNAAAVARHIGTHHTALIASPDDAQRIISDLPSTYDEPFADSSQIPTLLVSRLAKRAVTVVVSGDGGDELFGGYNRYIWAPRVWQMQRAFPRWARDATRGALLSLSPGTWDQVFQRARLLFPRSAMPGHHVHKVAQLLGCEDFEDAREVLVSHWSPSEVLVDGERLSPSIPQAGRWGDPIDQLMLADLVGYLPDDILAKVDRASMAVALEAREPLLDHRVVAFAWRLPRSMKIRGQSGKWLLRTLLHRYVPKGLLDRPKLGFGIPLGRWLRNELRDWAAELIEPDRLRREGLFRPEVVDRRWREHQRGVRNWEHHLWDILMFQAWAEAERRPARAPEPLPLRRPVPWAAGAQK